MELQQTNKKHKTKIKIVTMEKKISLKYGK